MNIGATLVTRAATTGLHDPQPEYVTFAIISAIGETFTGMAITVVLVVVGIISSTVWVQRERRAVRRALWAELQPVAVVGCDLRRFGEDHDGGYLVCGSWLDAVTAGYSYGINGYDGWGCGVATVTGKPVHQYDWLNTTVPSGNPPTTFRAD